MCCPPTNQLQRELELEHSRPDPRRILERAMYHVGRANLYEPHYSAEVLHGAFQVLYRCQMLVR